MKILRNKDYNALVNYGKGQENVYKKSIEDLRKDNEFYEEKFWKIQHKLIEIFDSINSSTSKDKIKKKLKELIHYIQKGK